MPDAKKIGDEGTDTFGHVLDTMGVMDIPNLKKLGLINLHGGGKMESEDAPVGRFMKMAELSNTKDTMTGHWEMMGIHTKKQQKTFTEHGFPPELIAELERRCGKKVIGN